MGSDSTVVKLNDITVKITKGTTPSKNDGGFADNGINYIKAESVSYDGRIDESTFSFIDESVHKKLKRSQLEENDILFSMAGAYLGKTGFVTKEHLPANTNQALALIRVNNKIANPKFIHYYLQQNKIIHFVNSSISQSAQPNINLQQIGDLDIILPPQNEQAKVVGFMSSLDNKITLNRQINQTLEQMAQALFKSWFVDFDPVVDNALDAGFFEQDLDLPDELLRRAEARRVVRKQSDFKPLPDATRQLFPAAFEECAEPSLGIAGWVPQGWKVGSLNDVTNVLSGFAFKSKEFQNSGLSVIKIKNIGSDKSVNIYDTERIDPSVAAKAERFRLKDGDLLMAMTGATVGKFGTLVSENKEAYYLNQRVAKFEPIDGRSTYLYCALNREIAEEYVINTAQGSAQPNISAKSILAMPLITAPQHLRELFNEMVNCSFQQIIQLRKQNITLTKMRDTLLPKLISGELRLDNIKAELVTDAVN
jgi:type I restriction enzyme, S subunit